MQPLNQCGARLPSLSLRSPKLLLIESSAMAHGSPSPHLPCC